MDNETVLELLLWISVVFSLPLLIISTMAVGKQTADLQYQLVKKVNGIRGIQSWVNLRTHINRVLFAGVLFISSVLVLIDAPIFIRTWAARAGLIFVLVIFTISAILDWIAGIRQLRILAKYEEVNNIGRMRSNMHVLANKLTEYYNIVDIQQIENVELDRLMDEITILVKDVQIDLHDMDPSYLPKEVEYETKN